MPGRVSRPAPLTRPPRSAPHPFHARRPHPPAAFRPAPVPPARGAARPRWPPPPARAHGRAGGARMGPPYSLFFSSLSAARFQDFLRLMAETSVPYAALYASAMAVQSGWPAWRLLGWCTAQESLMRPSRTSDVARRAAAAAAEPALALPLPLPDIWEKAGGQNVKR
jgi:hypothetical protein